MHHHHQGFRVVLRCYQNGDRKFKTIRLGRISIFTSLYFKAYQRREERRLDSAFIKREREFCLHFQTNWKEEGPLIQFWIADKMIRVLLICWVVVQNLPISCMSNSYFFKVYRREISFFLILDCNSLLIFRVSFRKSFLRVELPSPLLLCPHINMI